MSCQQHLGRLRPFLYGKEKKSFRMRFLCRLVHDLILLTARELRRQSCFHRYHLRCRLRYRLRYRLHYRRRFLILRIHLPEPELAAVECKLERAEERRKRPEERVQVGCSME